MTNEFLPCPFCGSIDVKDWYIADQYGGGVLCNKCGSVGRDIETWNTRASGWISVKDQLPINLNDVLTFIKSEDYVIQSYVGYWPEEPEYWMHLPKPPKESK